jgi:hypothetical protein
MGLSRRGGGGGGSKPPLFDDARKQQLHELKLAGNNSADRQVANAALQSILSTLPEDLQQQLAEREIIFALPAVPAPKTTRPGKNGQVRDWEFVVRPNQSLDDAVGDILNRRRNVEIAAHKAAKAKDPSYVIPDVPEVTPEALAEAVQYAVDSVGGDAARAQALGQLGGAVAKSRYMTGVDTLMNALDEGQANPKVRAVLSEYIGAPAGGTTVVTAPGDAAWMGQKPQLLAEVPVLKNATKGDLAIAGTGIGGAGLAFLADYLMGGDDRQPVAVVAPGGGGYR